MRQHFQGEKSLTLSCCLPLWHVPGWGSSGTPSSKTGRLRWSREERRGAGRGAYTHLHAGGARDRLRERYDREVCGNRRNCQASSSRIISGEERRTQTDGAPWKCADATDLDVVVWRKEWGAPGRVPERAGGGGGRGRRVNLSARVRK